VTDNAIEKVTLCRENKRLPGLQNKDYETDIFAEMQSLAHVEHTSYN